MTGPRIRVAIIVLAAPLLGSTSLAKFNVPNPAMEPTIKAGQQVEAELGAYGAVGEVRRGDVIVFRYPESPEHVFVKRVVGLPGETVSGKNGRLSINGVALGVSIVGDTATESAGAAKYRIKLARPCQDDPTPYKLTVPPGSLFVVGDNRCASRDSRHWGFLPFSLVLGRVTGLN